MKRPGRYRLVFRLRLRRWTLVVSRHYVGEMYGFLGSDAWQLIATITRDPR